MATPLNILIADDSVDDAEMIVAELRRAGFDPHWTRVETESDFLKELNNGPDIVLADYSLPHFSGMRAAELALTSDPNIPFILISGTVGEDIAVEAMKLGAADYFLKDRLARLGNSVQQALERRRTREKQRQTEAALNLFRMLMDQASDGIEVIDAHTGRLVDVNQVTCVLHGYTREEMMSLCVADLATEAMNPDSWRQLVDRIRGNHVKSIEGRRRRRDGSTFPVEITVRCALGDREYVVASVRDITERKHAEGRFREQFHELQRWQDAMLGREGRILELKHEVNELLAKLSQPNRYLDSADI